MEPRTPDSEVDLEELGERLAGLRLLPTRDAEMEASLRRYGQLSPLAAFRDQAGQLEIIDGFRRLRAAEKQRHPERLAVRVLAVDEVQALAALFALHRGRAGLCELEEGWLVQRLVRQHGLEQKQVGQLLCRDPSWVSRRLLLVEALAADVQRDVRLGLCSATAAREIARLPRGIQADCARWIASHGLSSRQAAKLVAAALQHGVRSAAELDALCASPASRPVHEQYVADVELLERLAARLVRRLKENPPRLLPPAHAVAVRARLRTAQPLLATLTERVADALEEDSAHEPLE
jgi:ParB-like chromosome segregation protein Spo0J